MPWRHKGEENTVHLRTCVEKDYFCFKTNSNPNLHNTYFSNNGVIVI
ncbi:hypothetical protein GECvBGOT_gp069c [Salmonella phage GEC_vB_GOT]|nr:hypothetical protein GECvBGOT_gp069c [Salmonella phage GEC_vB_GOT]